MSAKAKILARGSFIRIVNFFVHIAIAFYLMPFLIHNLGDRMYGLWVFVGSFIGFYGILDFGLVTAIHRFISRAVGRADTEEANRVANTALLIYSLTGLLTFLISVIAAVIAPYIVKNPNDAHLFAQLILIMGLHMAIGFPMRVLLGVLTSHLRFDIYCFANIAKIIIRTFLIILFINNGYGIISLAVITFCVARIEDLVIYFYMKNVAPYVRFRWSFVDKQLLKPLFHYSGYVFVSQVARSMRLRLDTFVITGFLGLSYVTIYAVAGRLIRYFSEFIHSAIGLMGPVFSQYESRGEYGQIREKFKFVTKISAYLSSLIAGILIIFGKPFIERWVGPQYVESYYLLLILIIPIAFSLTQFPSNQLLYGISKHKFLAIINISEAVCNVIISIILVQTMGLKGVAIGTIIPIIIGKIFIHPIYVCRCIDLKVSEYFIDVLLKPILKSALILSAVWFLTRTSISASYLSIIVLISVNMLFFSFIIYLIGFNKNERQYFNKVLMRA